jgi:hypothetical protein
MRAFLGSLLVLVLPCVALAQSKDGNRLAYLDEVNPYYPSRTFPKLITPQWVGEPGVEAVVILAIDDMREPRRYEAFLRPILRRLKQIDGRAPLSIMTNSVDPKDPQLQAWLKEGLSIECHTIDHPCPFFKGGFDKAKKTYDDCVDLMNEIPNNKPVAFRMPCCDSLNTPSPRFYAEIFNKTTKKGNFLSIDTSVFNVFTAKDPELPRQLVLNADGTERFRKYLPVDRSFVNYIEDYPYPYVIGRLCWQFPCVVPSDWEAQHLQKPNNPQTVRDWKAAIDCTMIKKGVFCLVFHPHGWIRNDQVVELVDYAAGKYGKKVKFLSFAEAQKRLNQHMLSNVPIRHPDGGGQNWIHVLDADNDGYLDVALSHSKTHLLWKWNERDWGYANDHTTPFEKDFQSAEQVKFRERFGVYKRHGTAAQVGRRLRWDFRKPGYDSLLRSVESIMEDTKRFEKALAGIDSLSLRDLDGDGICELITSKGEQRISSWSPAKGEWIALPFGPPPGAQIEDANGKDHGLRFIDLDGDGKLDIIFSNEKEYGIYLFKDMKTGWSRKVMAGKRSDPDALPMISRNGTNNGFWVHSGSLWWASEDTMLLKDHVDRRSIKKLLKGASK